MEIVLIIGGLLLLDLAAWRWGVDSTDGPDSLEWARRQEWLAGRSQTQPC